MKIALVVAMARNRVIGRDNRLPWHLPEDLRHFRALTIGKPVVMGRRTFESIGRALPGRTNIVITSQPDYPLPAGVERAASLQQALVRARAVAARDGVDECMVIGGAEVYRQCLPLAHRLHLTLLDCVIEGDTLFPECAPQDWRETARVAGASAADPGMKFLFLTFDRAEG